VDTAVLPVLLEDDMLGAKAMHDSDALVEQRIELQHKELDVRLSYRESQVVNLGSHLLT
jgi:hypothetical protein